MNILYREATQNDIELIATIRVSLINEDSGLTDGEKSTLYRNNFIYLQNAMKSGLYFAFLAYYGEKCVGTSSACLYSVLPGKKLPKGKQAYIQNVYVFPEYRRKGVGMELIRLTVCKAIKMGHSRITLSATEKGSALFKKCGFVKVPDVGLTDMEYATDDWQS